MEEHESLKYILRIFSKEVQYFECKYWTNEKKDKAVEESIENDNIYTNIKTKYKLRVVIMKYRNYKQIVEFKL